MIKLLITLLSILLAIVFFTTAERKVLVLIQRRKGPNVTGFWGTLQAIANSFKLVKYNMHMQNLTQNKSSFITKWAFLTNHKQIRTLYMMLGAFTSIVGLGVSIITHMELAQPGNSLLEGNHQLFNVAVTSHALAMIFFAMPFLIGGFGNWMMPVLLGAPNCKNATVTTTPKPSKNENGEPITLYTDTHDCYANHKKLGKIKYTYGPYEKRNSSCTIQ